MPNKRPAKTRKSTIRETNTRHIIAVAESLFAEKGYNGTTTLEISERAGLPKANVHYYFQTKEELYRVVLMDILNAWMDDAKIFETSDNPQEVLTTYIQQKMQHSFDRPNGAKVWALENIQGGPVMGKEIKKALIAWDKQVTQKIQTWIDNGLIKAISPQSLLNIIWASTQYYADYSYQIKVLNNGKLLNKTQEEDAINDITQLILKGTLN